MRNTLTILLLVFFSSCRTHINSSGNKLDLSKLLTIQESYMLAEAMYKKVTFIQPANIKDGLIGRYFDAKIFKDYLVLSNEDKTIQVYDRHGDFIFKTNIGKGPGEFHQTNDFTINFDSDEICILDFTSHKVSRISFEGKFLGDFNVKMGTTNLVYLGHGRFCFFTPYNYYEENGTHYDLLYIADTTSEIFFSKKMKREIANSPFVCSKNFMNCKGGATFCPDYCDTIQKVTANGFSDDLILSFGNMKMPEKYWESLDLYRQYHSKYLTTEIHISGNKYFIYYQCENRNKVGYACFDKTTNELIKGGMLENKAVGIRFGTARSCLYLWPRSVNSDNFQILYCSVAEIVRLIDACEPTVGTFYEDAFKQMQSIDKNNDNPVLILAELK